MALAFGVALLEHRAGFVAAASDAKAVLSHVVVGATSVASGSVPVGRTVQTEASVARLLVELGVEDATVRIAVTVTF